ncbi:MAG: YihY/virulence factor BrkB family protein [Phycisphaerales bacterium]|jgi:membrane protein|nr:YihY/virulence factor BrkB family protein [Phycisphaerales bacterium]
MRLSTILKWLRSAIHNPLDELSRWERLVRYTWKVLKQGASQLSEDSASTMAAALTYRTLFGVLPVTVVGAGVARSIMGESRFYEFLQNAMTASGLDQVEVATEGAEVSTTLGAWLTDLVTSGMNVNIATLTWLGVLLLIYSAVALMMNIEYCFNVICRSSSGRSWWRRIPSYWFLLTFGPIAAAVGLWADREVASLIESYVGFAWLLLIAQKVWSFFLCWGVLLLLYKSIPTAKLKGAPVMIGSAVAAILLMAGQATLSLYFTHAVSMKQLYGSLGLLPIFMFWLYLMWLIILLGLQVSSIFDSVTDR